MTTMDATYLKTLVDLRDRTIQKTRIGFNNRISAVERGSDSMGHYELVVIQNWHDRFVNMEKEIDGLIDDAVDGVEIVDRMVQVKGIGKSLAAQVISMVDISKADTVSALWKYAGMAVVDGERDRPIAGQKLGYNKRLKTICHKVGTQFLMCGSPYRREYDSAREYYEANRPEWNKRHCDLAARRKMIKLWLSHLWEVWRKIEGLPTPNFYSHEKLGHNGYKSPQEYGWDEV